MMKKVLEKEYKLQFIFPFIDVYSIRDSNKKIILINSNKITDKVVINDILCFMNINNYEELEVYLCGEVTTNINNFVRKMNVVKTVKITNDNGFSIEQNSDEYYSDSNNIEDYYSIIKKYIID